MICPNCNGETALLVDGICLPCSQAEETVVGYDTGTAVEGDDFEPVIATGFSGNELVPASSEDKYLIRLIILHPDKCVKEKAELIAKFKAELGIKEFRDGAPQPLP